MHKSWLAFLAALCCAAALASCAWMASQIDSSELTEAAWISLTIENGKPTGELRLIAGQAYVFDRITF